MPLLIAKNSIGKYLLYAMISLVFVGLGVFILSDDSDIQSIIMGWLCLIFFGIGLIIFLKQILDTRPRIIIDQKGIYDRTLGIGVIEWEDIENVYLNSIFGNVFISLILHDTEKYLRRISKRKARLAKYNRTLGFETINLNLSGVNVKPKEIFHLIIRQLTATKIKNLKNPGFRVELQNPLKKNVVSDGSSDSQA